MTKGEIAKQNFLKKYNCAQAVTLALHEDVGVDRELALSFAGAFGGGMRSGEVCGSVVGALMMIGCAYPFTVEGDMNAKARIGEKTIEFMEIFKSKYGCVRCEDLKKKGCPCLELIGFSADTAEKIIKAKQE